MKLTLHRLIAISAILVGFGFTAFAAENTSVSPADAALIAKARTNYPLKTCLVSGEDLGAMGEATAYIHRVAGQPDRVVFFAAMAAVTISRKSPPSSSPNSTPLPKPNPRQNPDPASPRRRSS